MHRKNIIRYPNCLENKNFIICSEMSRSRLMERRVGGLWFARGGGSRGGAFRSSAAMTMSDDVSEGATNGFGPRAIRVAKRRRYPSGSLANVGSVR